MIYVHFCSASTRYIVRSSPNPDSIEGKFPSFLESCLKTVQGSLGKWFNCREGVLLNCQMRAKEMAQSPEHREMEPNQGQIRLLQGHYPTIISRPMLKSQN